ncbi:MAG TPA: hypothetical protein VMH89_02520, partial [Candidatus Acidoferrum sp.]|nr:hypothetical protein [Candidatus Acidoferrum sp.]
HRLNLRRLAGNEGREVGSRGGFAIRVGLKLLRAKSRGSSPAFLLVSEQEKAHDWSRGLAKAIWNVLSY